MNQAPKLILLSLSVGAPLNAGLEIYPVPERKIATCDPRSAGSELDLSRLNLKTLEGIHLRDLSRYSGIRLNGNNFESLEPFEKLKENAGPHVTFINLWNCEIKVVTAAILVHLHKAFPRLEEVDLMNNPNINDLPIRRFREHYNHFTVYCSSQVTDSSSSDDSSDDSSDEESSRYSSNSADMFSPPYTEIGSDSSGSSSGVDYDSDSESVEVQDDGLPPITW